MGNTAVARGCVLLAMQTHLLWATLSVLLIASGAAGAAAGSPQVTVPPFSAEGVVSTKIFSDPRTANATFTGEAAVSFWYSNGWWQIECTFASPERVAGKVENCRRISDGVRYGTSVPQEFRGTADKVWPTAEALAIPFPPPPRVELFITWLALCPDPELPVIDTKRIRRLNLPQLLDHPKNVGTFSSKMLESGGSFLSELIVTNNGILFGPDQAPTQYPGPFADGFVETTFQAAERTNVSGISFPLHATFCRFSPRLGGKNKEDLRLGAITRLDVTRIGGLDTEALRRHAAPTLVVALDRRAPNLPDGITVNHIVTNDTWLPAKDFRMKALVAAYTGGQKPHTKHHWIIRGILVISILLPVTIYFLRRTAVRTRKSETP